MLKYMFLSTSYISYQDKHGTANSLGGANIIYIHLINSTNLQSLMGRDQSSEYEVLNRYIHTALPSASFKTIFQVVRPVNIDTLEYYY